MDEHARTHGSHPQARGMPMPASSVALAPTHLPQIIHYKWVHPTDGTPPNLHDHRAEPSCANPFEARPTFAAAAGAGRVRLLHPYIL